MEYSRNAAQQTYPPLRNTRNHLFDRVPEAEWPQIEPHLVKVDLPLSMNVTEPDRPVEHVYFPTRGMIPTVATTSAGESGYPRRARGALRP